MSDAGVMGYEPRNSGLCDSWLAATRPQAGAVLPLMLVHGPAARTPGRTSHGWSNSSAVSPKAWPALNAAVLASATSGRATKRRVIHSSVGSTGRVYIHEMRPRAKKFLDRSASRGLTPSGVTAPFVREVMGTS